MANARLKAALVRISAVYVSTEAQLEELAVQPDDERGGRKHLRHEHEQQERGAPGEAVARGVVGGGRGGQHDDGRRGQRDDQ